MDKNKLWEKAVEFHGHVCPGLTIGFKAVEFLQSEYENSFSHDEQIVTITENDTCAVDAVQSILGCTFGKGNLIYVPNGKMAFNFFFRNSGKKVRLYFKAENTENLSREEWQEWLFNADSKSLFKVSQPVLKCPEKARIFQSILCEKCGEKVREDKIRFENGQKVCWSCFDEYDR